jgi:hypothetical protein
MRRWRERRKGKLIQVGCVASFQIRRARNIARSADLEIGDTAGLETCATAVKKKIDLIYDAFYRTLSL